MQTIRYKVLEAFTIYKGQRKTKTGYKMFITLERQKDAITKVKFNKNRFYYDYIDPQFNVTLSPFTRMLERHGYIKLDRLIAFKRETVYLA